jgi:Mg2+ and Co2+ transporter CorA
VTKLANFLLTRLSEKSTITTIVTLVAGIVGANLAPEQTENITIAVVGVVSCIAAFWGSDKA